MQSENSARSFNNTNPKPCKFCTELFENAPIGIFQSTPEGRYLKVNMAMARMFGYDTPEQMVDSVTDIGRQMYVDPGERDEFKRLIALHGKVTGFESRKFRRDGSVIYTSINVRALYDSDDRIVYYHGYVSDISALKKKEEEVLYQIRFQKTVARISSFFVNAETEDFNRALQDSLRLAGEFVGADRSYVFLFSDDASTMDNFQEWCADGIPPQMVRVRNFKIDRLPWWAERIRKCPYVYVPDVENLPGEAEVEKTEWHAMGICSLLCLPLANGENCFGFMGFATTRFKLTWSEDQIAFWNVVAEIISRAFIRNQMEKVLQRQMEEQTILLDSIQTQIWYLTDEQTYGAVNRIHADFKGVNVEDMAFRNIFEIYPLDVAEVCRQGNRKVFGTGKPIRTEEWVPHVSGDRRLISILKSPKLGSDNRVEYVVCSAEDITDRKRVEEALRESEEKYRLTFSASPDSVNINRMEDGLFVDINEGFTRLSGYTREDVAGKTSLEVNIWYDPEDRVRLVKELREKGFCKNLEARFRKKDGSVSVGLMSARVIFLKGMEHIIAITRDITEHRQAEKEREALEAQLQQAQKMESVGRLAGGVAHDFNNKLSVILGYAELLQESISPNDPVHDCIEEIIIAGRQSADIVKQLLAFARKQAIAPVSLDINVAVTNLLNMLRRLIGEDIDLLWKPAANPWQVKMDSSQIDQILANLVVNARDAISGIGRVTIETGNIVFDKDYCSGKAGLSPGEFVMLAVSDDGCGMAKEIQEQLFEPFFTTKPIGQGTGLGLATMYGIVKQNNGFINVYSEPGKGTTFKIYLPRYKTEESTLQKMQACTEMPTGTETVLLVEDERSVLNLGKTLLEQLGYTVLAAGSPKEAIALAEMYFEKIHVLMTDVVMPEMNGQDLALHLQSICTGLKVLFMSGYTSNVIVHHGVLDEGVHFIQKPFSKETLSKKLREVIFDQR